MPTGFWNLENFWYNALYLVFIKKKCLCTKWHIKSRAPRCFTYNTALYQIWSLANKSVLFGQLSVTGEEAASVHLCISDSLHVTWYNDVITHLPEMSIQQWKTGQSNPQMAQSPYKRYCGLLFAGSSFFFFFCLLQNTNNSAQLA